MHTNSMMESVLYTISHAVHPCDITVNSCPQKSHGK